MSTDSFSSSASAADLGPFGPIPRLDANQVLRETRIARMANGSHVANAFRWLTELMGSEYRVGPSEVFWRAAGRGRPGVIAHLSWPEHHTRLAFGLENTLAHAIVDRSLGYERFAGEERLQVTPVEWGILTFAAARSLVELGEPRGLILDRVGPELFSIDDLGPIVTLRWSVRIGPHVGSARLWVPESVLEPLLDTVAVLDRPGHDPAALYRRFKSLGTTWHAVAGTVSRPAGFDLMNMVFPLDQTGLSGTVAAPVGPLELVAGGFSIPAEFPAESAGRSVTVTGPLARRSDFSEIRPMSNIPPAPTDVPVTLTVELGKISLPLDALADLQPGMTLSLNRHAREPVELTSAGRLVARGELIQIDDVLGVRILNVLL